MFKDDGPENISEIRFGSSPTEAKHGLLVDNLAPNYKIGLTHLTIFCPYLITHGNGNIAPAP